MSKKKITLTIVFTFIILVFIGLILYFFYKPMPIIDNPENCEIVKLAYNSSYEKGNSEFTELSEFNEQDILTCLSNYKEKKTLENCKGYSLNDYQFEIYIDTGNDLKSIHLGHDSFSSLSYGSHKYQIVNDEDLKNDLLKIIEEVQIYEKNN